MKRINEKNINTAEHWDQTYKYSDYDFEAGLNEFKVITRYITNGSKVIDLGCGTGECLQEIAEKHDCELWGVDISHKGVELAKGILPKANLRVSEATNTGINEKFDFVICTQTLEHLYNPHALAKEADRLLKPGGAILLTTPYLDHVPSEEHLWEFDERDMHAIFSPYFKDLWVFPWPSGRNVFDGNGKEVYPQGNWDELFVIGKK